MEAAWIGPSYLRVKQQRRIDDGHDVQPEQPGTRIADASKHVVHDQVKKGLRTEVNVALRRGFSMSGPVSHRYAFYDGLGHIGVSHKQRARGLGDKITALLRLLLPHHEGPMGICMLVRICLFEPCDLSTLLST